MSTRRPIVLCVLDGWGQRSEREDNAIAQARTPVWDRLMASEPHASLDASEKHVGLPEGQMGNSEVGHMNLGAGRVVMQELPRIDAAVADGSLARNPRLLTLIEALRNSGGTAHLLGLMSPGGVHSHQSHIAALARILHEAGIPVAVHALLDGRDTPPRSARAYMQTFLAEAPGATVATVTGRYFVMDRDKRWDRVSRGYAAMVRGEGMRAPNALAAIDTAYARDESDEFVQPTAIGAYRGMADGDGLLMANFRADRARQILTALVDPTFDGFERGRIVRFAAIAGMVEYSSALAPMIPALFPPQSLEHVLGEVVAEAGRRQLRIAETEKYAHVTFFFNGGEEQVFDGEERILVPSPKVATYDLQPEMSAPDVTDRLVEAIRSRRFDFILVNYANTDMVGHTGDLAAAIKAVEAVDSCLGRLEAAVREAGGALIVTADHGNAEQMRDVATGQAHTAHTLNLVPFLVINGGTGIQAVQDGCLADVAPTVLELMGLPQPAAMTGHSLILHQNAQRAAG
ncbi:MAG: 2,3-bisphosphoglycerate-independent phosphoglycerate mutase [Alphaproteobacteria bacterium]